jgi:hypothetical protein
MLPAAFALNPYVQENVTGAKARLCGRRRLEKAGSCVETDQRCRTR